MRVVRSSRCVAKLVRGEVRRTPKPAIYPPAGYYVGCPECGKVTPIVSTHAGGDQTFIEEETLAGDPVLTMTPAYECERCHASFAIQKDEIQVRRAS